HDVIVASVSAADTRDGVARSVGSVDRRPILAPLIAGGPSGADAERGGSAQTGTGLLRIGIDAHPAVPAQQRRGRFHTAAARGAHNHSVLAYVIRADLTQHQRGARFVRNNLVVLLPLVSQARAAGTYAETDRPARTGVLVLWLLRNQNSPSHIYDHTS